eukprot:m.147552 g.147552  ORF g.147552 m.147552 type:complete len:71 (-) comp16828_c0_seq9:454-666(-)
MSHRSFVVKQPTVIFFPQKVVLLLLLLFAHFNASLFTVGFSFPLLCSTAGLFRSDDEESGGGHLPGPRSA